MVFNVKLSTIKRVYFNLNFSQKDILFKILILSVSAVLAFACRLFAVIRYEAVIHEFDPYFNYRTTKFLSDEGFYNFHNWFDDRAWYPLGRIIGGTIYPGLMLTSSLIHFLLHSLHITLHVRAICVFLAPLFSSLTVFVTYLLGRDTHSQSAGLLAAALVAITPGYTSRSVAGSYDNEAIAIFCMLLTYWLWVRAVHSGLVFWSVAASLAYFYMVSSWGGYVFLINIIPLHVLVLMIAGRFNWRVYTAYSTFYALATILSMQIPFVGFQPVQSSEHIAALGVFALCQLHAVIGWLHSRVTQHEFGALCHGVLSTLGLLLALLLTLVAVSERILPWTGRFYTLLDPSYAKNHIPIIASVSEHQPTSWCSFYFDFQSLMFFFPVGLYFCFKRPTNENIFVVIYATASLYFSGVMVRLMLVLAPAMCLMSAIGASSVLNTYFRDMTLVRDLSRRATTGDKRLQRTSANYFYREQINQLVLALVTVFLVTYSTHCLWVTSEAYSSPSIVLSARTSTGRVILDDFREAYFWLRQNTHPDARVMSWWDYGYQITAMANRTTIVDNNTWNNTHISRVGQTMASTNEAHAYSIMRELDVDYVLVIFGGFIGYSSDDIAKFLWMVRIGGSTPQGAHIVERDYLSKSGEYRVDERAGAAMLDSFMYKLSYYRFGELKTDHNKPSGYDRVRNCEIGRKQISLEVVDEAYTTEHWIVRIYKVKRPSNRV